MDSTRPTLFELIAQDQLRDLLQPAIRYVLVYYAERYPRYLLRIANSSDELYAVLMALVENHFITHFGGTFTENFYGLKRERAPRVQRLGRVATGAPGVLSKIVSLRTRDRIWAITLLVGIPYIKAKLDEQYELYGAQDQVAHGQPRRRLDELPLNATRKQRIRFAIKQAFKKAYPGINAVYHISTLYFSLAYMFGSSEYHTLSHAFLRQRVRRLDGQNYRRIEEAADAPIALPPNSSLSPLAFSRILIPRLFNTLKHLLPLGIFFLKFLEWWSESDFAAQLARKTSSNVDLPAPPPASMASEENMASGTKQCRICGKTIVNPTALQTGYVVCYVCGYKWVERHGTCPVSGVRLLNGINGLRRLMI
ncbi:Pex12 amino terminal region-domain-containing protein [Protomyces lactucae-debilis]|uniref:Peroxisome assembly protein 12 n=1 Tax=Protomyces lactucae-debilis TaxID=2754530 RepID=A0A1Y2F5G5_PROLT|nr:Pex12 amino terminal region-domain-containing protein [Protomyces lactucae-debilis]ORY78175.1 Pex12 amino terminal region-domain-containing protein [Protomyces lactucae-debilis]